MARSWTTGTLGTLPARRHRDVTSQPPRGPGAALRLGQRGPEPGWAPTRPARHGPPLGRKLQRRSALSPPPAPSPPESQRPGPMLHVRPRRQSRVSLSCGPRQPLRGSPPARPGPARGGLPGGRGSGHKACGVSRRGSSLPGVPLVLALGCLFSESWG